MSSIPSHRPGAREHIDKKKPLLCTTEMPLLWFPENPTNLSDIWAEEGANKQSGAESREPKRMNHFYSPPRYRTFAERNLFVFACFSVASAHTHAKSIIELAHDEWKLNYGLPSWRRCCCFIFVYDKKFLPTGDDAILLFTVDVDVVNRVQAPAN